MINLTPEERAIGRDNYYEAVGVTRRDFLRGVVGAGAVSGGGLGAMYFGYGEPGKGLDKPLRIGFIGTGDEGGVLIGSLNPNYVQVVAIADIRPYNIHRAFHGDATAAAARPGLMSVYDWKTEDEARRNVKVYDQDYHDLVDDPNVEEIIIALPLFLHHPVALEAMAKGKHVLTEKLMAHDVGQCKEMARAAEHTKLYLAVGHQRHYSVLYDNAVNLLKWNTLG
ncbi:MAG: Gfo/Idh/MocA family oxidoreductase, partial [Planctomycetales bacterium]|nr:Gfo/Idh/MocA family oxidoreductase [Planctomycetales bacterium]